MNLQEGGLGDVVTALGRAVQDEGHDVEVVLPKYDCINYNLVQARPLQLGCKAAATAACLAAGRPWPPPHPTPPQPPHH